MLLIPQKCHPKVKFSLICPPDESGQVTLVLLIQVETSAERRIREEEEKAAVREYLGQGGNEKERRKNQKE